MVNLRHKYDEVLQPTSIGNTELLRSGTVIQLSINPTHPFAQCELGFLIN